MNKRMTWLAFFLVAAITGGFAQKNYTEGQVMRIVHIRILPGHSNDFWADLNNNSKKLWEAAKAQGLIEDYRVYINETTSGKEDWDVGYTLIFKDMAALDGLTAKAEKLSEDIAGGAEKRQEIISKRVQNAEVVASYLARQVTLK